MTSSKEKKERWFRRIAIVSSLLIGFVILELGLRVVLGSPPTWKVPQETYVFDPVLQHRLEPNQKSWSHAAKVETNSLGYRGEEWTANADGESCRLLALGDSQTFGVGVELKETWPAKLEAALNQQSVAFEIEVLNAGVPGTNTWQHAIMLEELHSKVKPDGVVLGFFVNDVARPFTPDPDMAESTRSPTKERVIALLRRSATLNSFRNLAQAINMMVRPSRAMEADQHVVDGTPDPLIDAAWESVEDSLRRMRDTCNQRQIPFMVFAMPRRDQISGATQARAYNDRLASIAQKLEIPYVDTLDALQDLYQAEGPRQVNIAWDGHHTALANETIANTILETTLEAVHKSCGRLRPVE